jgi:hypothetical protein
MGLLKKKKTIMPEIKANPVGSIYVETQAHGTIAVVELFLHNPFSLSPYNSEMSTYNKSANQTLYIQNTINFIYPLFWDLQSVERLLRTDFSGHPIGPIKGQTVVIGLSDPWKMNPYGVPKRR